MRIRFTLLVLVLMLAVSACGPKYVGQSVDVKRAGAVPMVLGVGETKEAFFPLKTFWITYNVTRSTESTYSVEGRATPRKSDERSWIDRGHFYILLVKDGVVVEEYSLNFGSYFLVGSLPLSLTFNSQGFDHVLAAYNLKIKTRFKN